MKEVDVLGLQLEPTHNLPLVLLGEQDEPNRLLAMIIGPAEAAAITLAIAGAEPFRPMTHDLLVAVTRTVGAEVRSADITEQNDGSFLAELVLGRADGEELHVDARPSDAIAVALRVRAPVLVNDRVLDDAGFLPPPPGDAAIDAEVDQFRAFLDEIDPEAFQSDAVPPPDPAGEVPEGDSASADDGPADHPDPR